MNDASVRIVVADDHPLILAGFAALIQDRPEFEVIARCDNGESALNAIVELKPHIAVLDLNMPKKNGLAIAEAVGGSDTRIVLISAMLTPQQVMTAQQLGVAGILLKDAAPDELIACLLSVAAGGEWRPAKPASNAASALPASLARQLTAREMEVAALAALGLSNKSIARRLELSDGTVKIHMYNVFRKTGLHNRTELANLVNQNVLTRADAVSKPASN
jgi:DNA-binding NarL/FixJ family response regulator